MPSNYSLNNFAYAVNSSMGWEFSHLYLFKLGKMEVGNPEYDEGSVYSDRNFKMHEVVADHPKFQYIYDFGDNWVHEIEFEKGLPADPNEKYPVCIEGENACPPEDCGGVDGFQELKDALCSPSHPRHIEFLEWRGPYDPKVFDLGLTNLSLIRRKIGKNVKLKA